MFKVFKTSGIESLYSISANALFSTDGWTIYPLKHKQSKKQCSVWVYDKKKLEAALTKMGVIHKSNKHIVLEECFQVLRNYVSSLVKLKHPSLLHVIEPLEDHKSRALFVTEYVVGNLSKMDKQDLDEIMITKGLLQVSHGLQFIHENLQSVHLNIQPSTIFINENFDWKLSGLNFCQSLESGTGELNTFDPRMPIFVNVNYRFSSPNLVLNHTLSYDEDLFSIALLIYYLFNCKNINSSSPYLINCENNNLSEYQRDIKKLDSILSSRNMSIFRNIPENYLKTFLTLLDYNQLQGQGSWSIAQFIESNIFNNELIKILNFFDSFQSQEPQDQFKFLNKFKNYSLKFPKILLLNKFLPILCDLLETFTKDPKKQITTEEENLIYITLDNVLIISQNLSQLSFIEKVYPKLNQTIQSQGLTSCKILIINSLKLIEEKLGVTASADTGSSSASPSKNFEMFLKFLMTLFKNGITPSPDQQSLQFQERVLTNLSTFTQFQNYHTISNVIFPDVCQLFTKTTSLKIKSLTIDAFVILLKDREHSLDTFIIVEKLLPILQNTSTKTFGNADFLKKLVSLYNEIFVKLVSKKQDLTNLDILLEQVYFQIWKLLKFSKSVVVYDYIVGVIGKIDKFLVLKYRENLSLSEREDSPMVSATVMGSTTTGSATTISHSNRDDDDDFGDFSGDISPMASQLKPSTPKVMTPATRLQLKPSARQVSTTPLTPSSNLSFGSTSSNNTSHLVASLKQAPASTPVMNTTTNTNTTIDWTPATKNTPNLASLTPAPATNNTSYPPGFSMGLIQPTKKQPQQSQPLANNTTTINWNANNGASLI